MLYINLLMVSYQEKEPELEKGLFLAKKGWLRAGKSSGPRSPRRHKKTKESRIP
jgi:hypothetical protein